MRGIASGNINPPITAKDVHEAQARGAVIISNVYILSSIRALKAIGEKALRDE